MRAGLEVRGTDYLGLFLVTLAALSFQILLTRIFSVTVWYHFAFMAISISMFGLAAGALLVHRYPRFFTMEKTRFHLAMSALGFGVSIAVCFLTLQSVPFLTIDLSYSLVAAYSIVFIFVVLSIPFIWVGLCVCLALTRPSTHVGRLYAADMSGSALGCLLVVPALRTADAPTAVMMAAAAACLGALCFAAPAMLRGESLAAEA